MENCKPFLTMQLELIELALSITRLDLDLKAKLSCYG